MNLVLLHTASMSLALRTSLILALFAGAFLALAPVPVAANNPVPVVRIADQPAATITLRVSAAQAVQLQNARAVPVEVEIRQQQFRVYLPALVSGASGVRGTTASPATVPLVERLRIAAGQSTTYRFERAGNYTVQLVADDSATVVLATVLVSSPATPEPTATATAAPAEPTAAPPFVTSVPGTVQPTATDPAEVLPSPTATDAAPLPSAVATRAPTTPPPPRELTCDSPQRSGDWRTADVGDASTTPGKIIIDGSSSLVCGSGSQMWGTTDGLYLAYLQRSGDVSLLARLDQMSAVHPFSKVGLTLRNSTRADAAHFSVMFIEGSGVRVQWRSIDGNGTTDGVDSPAAADTAQLPVWLRIVRSGTTVQAFSSTAATPAATDWVALGNPVALNLNQSVLAGMFVSARDVNALSSAHFANIELTGLVNPPVPSAVPPTAAPPQASPTARPTQAPPPPASPTARPTQAPPSPVPANGHPRLFVTASELPTIRQWAQGSHNDIWVPIERFAREQAAIPAPTGLPADDTMFEYRAAGNTIIPLAFACMVGEDEQICRSAVDYLLAYSRWSRWDAGSTRDLGMAHMLQGNALAYDWLYSRLNESQRQQVRGTLAREARKMYEASSQEYNGAWNNWWANSFMQNHYWANNAGIGMAGYALLGEVPEARGWVDYTAERLRHSSFLLDGIGDGTWHEGISYQQYGLSNMLPFLYNLQRLDGVDVIPDEYMNSYGTWRVYSHLHDSMHFIIPSGSMEWEWIGDGLSTNLLRFSAGRYNDPHAEWLVREIERIHRRSSNNYQTPWQVMEFFYYNPQVTPASPASLPKSAVFPDLSAVIWRTGWGADDLVFGFKSGVYGGHTAYNAFVNQTYPYDLDCAHPGCQLNIGHDHLDTNSFYLARGNNWLAPEMHGYGEEETAYHNTILIDGKDQYEPNPLSYGRSVSEFAGSDGRLEVTSTNGSLSYLRSDATRRYKNTSGIEEVRRHVAFVRPGYLVVLDELAAQDAHAYTWKIHAERSITRDGDWLRGSGQNDQVLGIAPLAPASWSVSFGNNGKPFAEISPAQRTASVRLVHLLYPTTGSAWASRPTASVIADTGEALHVRVTFADGSYDDLLIAYNQNGSSSVSISGYTLTGYAAVVRHAAGGQQTEQHVIGGEVRR